MSQDEPQSQTEPQPAPAGRRRHRLRNTVLLLLVILIALVAAAPTILSLDPVMRYALQEANRRLPMTVASDAWSLSWLGSQEVRGLAVQTQDGQRVVRVEGLTIEKSLVGLLADHTHLDTIRLADAEVWADGVAALRDALPREEAPKPPKPPGAPSEPVSPVMAHVVDVRNLVLHAGTSTFQVDHAVFETGEGKDRLEANLKIQHGDAQGSAVADVHLTGLTSDWQGAEALGAAGTIKCRDLPLAAVWAVLSDLGIRVEGGGTLSLDATFTRTRTGDVTVQAIADGTALSATGDLLHGDRPALEALHVAVDGALAGRVVTVKTFELKCPVATAVASGTFGLAATDAEPPKGKGSAQVTLDVAPLARMLPNTLSLHKDLVVEGGTVLAVLEAESDERVSHLKLAADVNDLRGKRGETPIALAPVRLAADVERDHPAKPTDGPPKADWLTLAQGLRVNTLTFSGAFGSVQARGRMEAFSLDAQLYLAKAAEEVGRFVDLKGYGAGGTARVSLKTEGTLERGLGLLVDAAFKDLVLDFGEGRRWLEPQAKLAAEARLTFDAANELTGADVKTLNLDGKTATLQAHGTVTRTKTSWAVKTVAQGVTTVGNAGAVASFVMPILEKPPPTPKAAAAEEPEPAGEPAGGLWRDLVDRAARGEGRCSLSAQAEGELDKAAAVQLGVVLSDLVVPPPAPLKAGDPQAPPLRVATANFKAEGNVELAAVTRAIIRRVDVTLPGLSARVEGPATVASAKDGVAMTGSLKAAASADLEPLARTLQPLGLLPDGAKVSGQVDVQAEASAAESTLVKAKVVAVGQKVDAAWPDERRLTETYVRLTADPTLTCLPDGTLTRVDVSDWTLKASAGEVAGTAVASRGEAGWGYGVKAKGGGPIGPLARTVSGLLGSAAQPIRGLWSVSGSYDDAKRTLALTASATNLEIPQEGDPPKPNIRVADVRLQTEAVLGQDGRIEVSRADLKGAGLDVKARGMVHIPPEPDKPPAADGTVVLKANLAEFVQVLRPFGVLPDDVHMAGTADFDGKVGTQEAGVSGSGLLNLADLNVEFPKDGIAVRETKAVVPVGFIYTQKDRRWAVQTKQMKAETVSGDLLASIVPGKTGSRLQATCDVTCDAKRVRDLLGKQLPPVLKMAGLWRVLAEVAGPLPAEGEWNQYLAGLAGAGSVDVDQLEYETLKGGKGTLRWRLADGQLLLSPDPQRPSRLALAGGAIVLGGRILLRESPPRLVITEPLNMVEGLPLGGEEIQQYLKYTSPVLAASVGASGRFSMTVESLNLPLAEGAAEKATASGTYRIDEFRTELIGPLGNLVKIAGAQSKTPVQPFGPIAVRLADGFFSVPEHDLQYSETVRLRFGGRIGVDKRMNVMVGVPITEEMLSHYKVSPTAAPFLRDTTFAVPLTGTIDKPELDEKAVAKRLAELAVEAIKRQALEWLKGGLLKPK